MKEPILGKSPPDRRHYRPLTWPIFRKLRAWAKVAAERHHARVYLVGSSLVKARPRDIDLAIVLPTPEIEERFGAIPNPNSEAMQAYLRQLHLAIIDDHMDAQIAVRCRQIDVKLAPDCWWPDKDKLLLASAHKE